MFQRLEQCRRDFANPLLAKQAFRWGFSDASHLSRSFKRPFSMSAQEFRARAIARSGSQLNR